MTITLYIIGYVLCGLLGAWIGHAYLDDRRHDTSVFAVICMCAVGPITLFGVTVFGMGTLMSKSWKAFGKLMDKPAFKKRED